VLDPDLRRRLEPFRDDGWPELLQNPAALEAYAQAFAFADGYEPPTVRVQEEQIEGPIGSFRLRLYEPQDADPSRPVLVWVHGGGFVAGDLDMREADVVSREVCVRADAVVVSVDYHVVGGTASYPVLHQEVAAAVRWVRAEAHRLGVDASALTVGGASAGANLALAATFELRFLGEELPHRLALAYPALHRELREQPHLEDELAQLPPTLRFDAATVEAMFTAYLGENRDASFATADGNDLAGLPDCLVIVSEYDDLRCSGVTFAEDAATAGVATDLYVARGMPHGHLSMTPLVSETDASLQRLADFVSAD
jgi:acetyl esterase